eukprot:3856875-Rhodomonas_salina.2
MARIRPPAAPIRALPGEKQASASGARDIRVCGARVFIEGRVVLVENAFALLARLVVAAYASSVPGNA